MLFRLYLPQIIYGGIDGIVTTFAVVAGATGWNLSEKTIVILWIANLLADWCSMSIGAYLSARKEKADLHNPYIIGLTTFLSFVIIGVLSILPYIFEFWSFITSCVITGFAFVIIGLFKWYMDKGSYFFAVFQTLILGTIAASVAYYVGGFLANI